MAEMEKDILEERDLAALRKRILGLETLLELTRSLVSVQERKRLEGFLMLTVMGILSVSRAILLARLDEEDSFRIHARGLRGEEVRENLRLRPSGLFARRMRVARGLVDLRADGLPEREARDIRYLKKNRLHHATPIRMKDKLYGILILGERVGAGKIAPFESQMLRSMLDIAGIVMDNADLYDEMRKANLSIQEQNERLKGLDQMKNQFLSTMGHELRTPITCIIGFAECLRYPGIEDDKKEEFANNILGQSNRLTNLIDQVLDLSALSEQSLTLHPEKGNVNTLIQEVAESLKIDIHHKKLSLDLELNPTLPEAYFDTKRTGRAVRNLLDNAIKFSPENGHVKISSAVDEDEVSITVSDDGQGIPEEAIPSIFERFHQLDSSDTRSYGGAGIGLSLVKEIMEKQGGSVSVESRPGKGSVFTLRLPRTPKPESEPSDPVEQEAAT